MGVQGRDPMGRDWVAQVRDEELNIGIVQQESGKEKPQEKFWETQ